MHAQCDGLVPAHLTKCACQTRRVAPSPTSEMCMPNTTGSPRPLDEMCMPNTTGIPWPPGGMCMPNTTGSLWPPGEVFMPDATGSTWPPATHVTRVDMRATGGSAVPLAQRCDWNPQQGNPACTPLTPSHQAERPGQPQKSRRGSVGCDFCGEPRPFGLVGIGRRCGPRPS